MADPHIKVTQYEHFNKSLGKHITSKKHYKEEMQKSGCVSFEEGERLASKARSNRPQYKPSEKAESFMREVRQTADKNGKVKLSDRAIDHMKKLGVKFEGRSVPNGKGGFY